MSRQDLDYLRREVTRPTKTLQWIPVVREGAQEALYLHRVCGGNPSCAISILSLWARPWSGTALRWANHVLTRAANRGLLVLG